MLPLITNFPQIGWKIQKFKFSKFSKQKKRFQKSAKPRPLKLERFAWSHWIRKYLTYFGNEFRPRPQAASDAFFFYHSIFNRQGLRISAFFTQFWCFDNSTFLAVCHKDNLFISQTARIIVQNSENRRSGRFVSVKMRKRGLAAKRWSNCTTNAERSILKIILNATLARRMLDTSRRDNATTHLGGASVSARTGVLTALLIVRNRNRHLNWNMNGYRQN